MSHIETRRLNDLIALKIAAIKELGQTMSVDSELVELETLIAGLEEATAELKSTLKAIPHHPA